MAAAAAVLRARAARLEGGDGRPDFTRLDTARVAVARALARRLTGLPADTRDDALLEALAALAQLDEAQARRHGQGQTPKVNIKTEQALTGALVQVTSGRATKVCVSD